MICPLILAGLSQNMTAEESVIAMRNRLSECLKKECAWWCGGSYGDCAMETIPFWLQEMAMTMKNK